MPAPPNNRNALKHGLYSRRIKSDQSTQLVKVQPLDVEHEISVLRAIIDNILGEIESSDDLDQKARLYNSLFSGVTTLNTTIRTHALLSGKNTELEEQIEQGKIFARQRLNIYAYLTPVIEKPEPKRTRKKGSRAPKRSG